MALKDRLVAKITRERLRTFLTQHRCDGFGLEVGAKYRTYADLFPNAVAGDLFIHGPLDAQFDAHHLPFATNCFEYVLCTEVLEHCTHPHAVIDEFYRVLAPGGKLILSTRFIFPIHDAPYDYFRFTRYGLERLCQDFRSVEVTAEAATVETMGVLSQRLGYQVDWRLPMVKLMLFLSARLMLGAQRLVRREYGDIHKSQPEQAILASGYYLVAVK